MTYWTTFLFIGPSVKQSPANLRMSLAFKTKSSVPLLSVSLTISAK